MIRKRNNAFSLFEVLISMVILAVLLAAVAVAVHASIHSHNENIDTAAVVQTARFVLNRMMKEIRTAAAADATASQITIVPPDDGSGLTQLQYDYDGTSLLYRRTISGVVNESVLLDGTDEVTVTTFEVTKQTGLDWQGTPCTKSITVHMALTVDGKTFWITASSSPRRNQTY